MTKIVDLDTITNPTTDDKLIVHNTTDGNEKLISLSDIADVLSGDTSLTELNDVTITSVATGEVLKYNGTSWVNANIDADEVDDSTSANKFTTAADIAKLLGIETGATADQTDSEIKTAYENNVDTNAFTDAEKTQLSNTPNDFSGIENHDHAIVTLNVDITKLDITAATYFIMGVKYTYAGGTAVSPTIAAADSSTWVGLDSTGLVYSPGAWSNTDKHTILPLVRLQAVSGDSGPGSQLQEPVDQRYTIGEEAWVNRVWLESVAGVLHPQDGNDGLVSENATPLYVDQTTGTVYDAQRKDFTVPSTSQISARALYHVAGSWGLQADATLVVPKFYDDGTDIVALSVGKWAAHTLLRTPKDTDSFTLVYSQTDYNSQAEAEAAGVDYGLYVSQTASTLYPVANLIVKGNSTAIESIVDLRPKMGNSASSIIGTANMQQIYENSTTPEIVTDTTRGAHTVQGGTGTDTDLNYESKNNAGTTTFSVASDGDVVVKDLEPTGTVDGRDVATDGTKLDGVEVLADVTDETNVKSSLDGATIANITVVSADKVLVQDISDSDNLKSVTAQSIADLVPAGANGEFHVYASANFAHTGALTKVVLNTEVYDTNGEFDSTTNYRHTPLTAGKYFYYATMGVNDLADGAYYRAHLYLNGVQKTGTWVHAGDPGLSPMSTFLVFTLDMNGTTDYVELYTSHNGTNTTTQLGGQLYGGFGCIKVA